MDASYVLVGEQNSKKSRSFAHDWSKNGTNGGLKLVGRNFVDGLGRVCIPRGVNLSGNCKTPPNRVRLSADEDERHVVTFVGRPFPLSEAHEHLARLRRWGLTFIRFLITWEAIEHAGPGVYDEEYLDYLHDVLSLLPQYQMTAYVSMHQDVWSRYSGGSGAPAWTLEAVGFDLTALEEAGAAWLGGVRGEGHKIDTRGLWPTGYHKLAAATMATCFFAGNMFASKVTVTDPQTRKEVSIQDFLQDRFLACWKRVAEKVGHLEGVLGFQMINEPHPGYACHPDLHGFNYNTDLHLGHIPSPLQSFALGAGHPTIVPTYTRSFPMPTRKTKHHLLNPKGRSVWKENGPTGGRCLWEIHGVWGWDMKKEEAVPLRENYFVRDPRGAPDNDRKLDWYTEFYLPFFMRWSEMVQGIAGTHKMLFAEPIPNQLCPPQWSAKFQPPNMVFAPHWYDLNALFTRGFGNFTINVQGLAKGMFLPKTFYWGHGGARNNYSLQIRNIVEAGYRSLPEKPVCIGECGIPFDMNESEAFHSGDFQWQMKMMDAMCTGLERTLASFNLWNYNPDNDDAVGDDWCGENFSWFSNTRARPVVAGASYAQTDESLDKGGRILRSIVRAYPAKVAGIPLDFSYDLNTGRLYFVWAIPNPTPKPSYGPATILHPPLNADLKLKSDITEIFIPAMLARGRKVVLIGAGFTKEHYEYVEELQTLYVRNVSSEPGHVHWINVGFDQPPDVVIDYDTQSYNTMIAYSIIIIILSALVTWYANFGR
ncbi:cytoplasmic protein [Exidia glandulosa HHB12029]|uniref:Cytoplasmic protein n=1 Tax=Exidia glandulosa HHB12029 TaxID=1314781 RepID=A0A165EI59_EXIGL|nr:cytoplasmic protein [Exidia glandulosa HHB12029]